MYQLKCGIAGSAISFYCEILGGFMFLGLKSMPEIIQTMRLNFKIISFKRNRRK